ncbi:hypothetical protein SAMN05192568_1007166 [Methylobacterium pseudosasicola]|uniref:Uncharacterized protein n=1 Tax=Methylobacterium pseudosasicola TaxID=582667 RepID=A0A1I4J6K9_9HYPH|nr:hypothetical protein SAMN05192568_1007166 [Methylobacterium pseudosasicola]
MPITSFILKPRTIEERLASKPTSRDRRYIYGNLSRVAAAIISD